MRIAVCMYGQYRTFQYCQKYLTEYYKDKSTHEFDFFCSLKNYDLGQKDGQNKVRSFLNQKKIDRVKKVFDPKILTVIKHEQDEKYDNVNWKMFNGLAEVIYNKRLYELKNEFEYDLVILQRYDNIVVPLNSLSDILEYIDNHKEKTKHNTPNVIYHMGMVQSNNELCTEIQDLSMMYTGSALELIIADFFNYNKLAQKYRSDCRFNAYPDENIHSMIYRLGCKNCIEFEKLKLDKFIDPLVVRNGTYIKDNILLPSTWTKIKNFWIKTEMSTFEKITKSKETNNER